MLWGDHAFCSLKTNLVRQMKTGSLLEKYKQVVALMVRKKEYLEEHDVETSVEDTFVCGQTNRIVLLLKEVAVGRRNATPKWLAQGR